MKPVFTVLFVLSFSLAWSGVPDDWGRNGHRATAQIADTYLTRKARRNIQELLDGQTLALVSTYADEIKSDPSYRSYGPWHYINFPFDKSLDEHPRSDRGDLLLGIETSIAVLKDDQSSKEEKVFHLKLLVHLMGDLHQPMHVGKAIDKGGNDFQVKWFGQGTNLHSVWDTEMIESYEMSYSELASNAVPLGIGQYNMLTDGSLEDWIMETRSLCLDVYENTRKGEKLGYDYMYRYMGKVQDQLRKGGVRLAYILNQIFD